MESLINDIKDVEDRTGLGVVIGTKSKEITTNRSDRFVRSATQREYVVLLVPTDVQKDMVKMVMLGEVDLDNLDNEDIRSDMGGGVGDTVSTALLNALGSQAALETAQLAPNEHRAIVEASYQDLQRAA